MIDQFSLIYNGIAVLNGEGFAKLISDPARVANNW